MMVETRPNEIYDDRVKKYTINIPLEIYKMLEIRTGRGTEFGGQKSTYIRQLIQDDLKKFKTVLDRPTTMADVEHRETVAEAMARGRDPARKYVGFIGGLTRNSFVSGWFGKHKK